MSRRADRDLLGDILEALRRAGAYIADQSYEQFLADTKTQDAIIRTLEIVGEATQGLSPALRESHPGIPWKNMAGLRDKLIHDPRGCIARPPTKALHGLGDRIVVPPALLDR